MLLAFAVLRAPLAMGDELAAPNSAPKGTVRLDVLVAEAIEKRPSLRAADFDAQAKEAEIGPKGSYENPMFGFSAMNYPIDTLSGGEFSMTGNELSLTQRIPFPGKLGTLSKVTSHEAQAKRADFDAKKLDLIREVKLGYYALYLAYKRRDVLNEQVSVVRSLIAVTRSKYTLGKQSQADVLSLQMEEGNLMDQLLSATREIEVKTGDLNHAVGRTDHHEIARPEDLKKTELNLSKLSEQDLGERILAKNPVLKSTESDLAASEERVSYAKKGYLPDFEFRLAYTLREPSPGDRGVNFVSGGVALSLPIWAFSKESEEVRGAKAERAKMQALEDEERIHMLHMVHSSFSELKEASERLKLIEGGLLPLAKQTVTSGRSAYLTGKMDYTTHLNQIRSRYQIELSYYEALANYESKIAEFEALSGGPLGDR